MVKTLKTAQAILAVALLSLAGSAFGASFTGSFDGFLPDNDPNGISNTISIGDSGVITSLTVDVAIDHTWVGDLILTLTAPDGTVLTLMDRPGFPDALFGTDANVTDGITFDDSATITAEGVLADVNGNLESSILAPDNMLAGLNGLNIAGDWTLTISDNAPGDTNDVIIPSWTLNIETAVVPVPAALWLMLSAVGGLGLMRRKS